jgi:hypothetical protein
MKKLTIILLMLVYGLSSSGMSITVHYCMSDFAGWDLSSDASSAACSSCGMKKQERKGCCHDEKKTVKSEKDQKNVEVFVGSLKAPVTILNENYSVYSPDYFSNTIKGLPSSHAPPYENKVAQYIYNCSFRI